MNVSHNLMNIRGSNDKASMTPNPSSSLDETDLTADNAPNIDTMTPDDIDQEAGMDAAEDIAPQKIIRPENLSIQDCIDAIMKILDDDKAEEIVTIDLEGKTEVCDQMIIANGRSSRHVSALADKIARELKDLGFGRVHVEGLPSADWVLVDAGDVITHLFRPEVRDYYNLERIWTAPAQDA